MTGETIWMTSREAADHCGVHIRTVQSWARRGHLPVKGLSPHGRPLYDFCDVARAEMVTRAKAKRVLVPAA
ncbi:MerR family transcriptional regulator [Streptomyces avermitilis]|uniref:MerR family transcriptional regulator n=1 Tax=Streptomyces avermitilis TaxID=33903 RepID=UPI003711865E